ncbi:MAG: Asp-tRNA(Asn)/Glu-tRNA(Gln) amidotransferase subunit GatB [Deltaproteobacteria bacterium]|nr:Asp-tRNA(Asn)/Glu-tRNA(Gln) amidotransferase subunit GatB [Deltaproteobacteria bacterium]
MEYEAVIGLEVHAQLKTKSKIFCGCSTAFGADPNHHTCPVCLGMPGVLPVLNREVVNYTIRTGLALNCTINSVSRFARKNYFYPDLPKGYQISQYELPLCEHGHLIIDVNGTERRIGITRIHMEEDAGKNIHGEKGDPSSYVDLNRTGVPLMEIVSEPDIRTPEEAAAYMRKLRSIVRYLDVCDGNMEEGSLRCDANISLRPVGATELGVKAELKNMNSFRNVQKALEYEVKRQTRLLEEGGSVIQETRLWDTDRGMTLSMRGKEEAHDYRYFPDPDLVPLQVDHAWIEEVKGTLPELPDAKRERFVTEYDLPRYDAEVLTASRELAAYFEECNKRAQSPKVVSNWIMGDLLRECKGDEQEILSCPVRPEMLAEMIGMIGKGTISGKIAKTVFAEMMRSGKSPGVIVKEKNLVQITDEGEIVKIVEEVIAANPAQVDQFRAGKEKVLGFFVGQVMKASRGKANPAAVNKLLKERL